MFSFSSNAEIFVAVKNKESVGSEKVQELC